MSSGSYAFKMKFNLSVTVLMVVAKESEICYRLNLQKPHNNYLTKVRGVFRALSYIWDGAFGQNK